MRASTSGADASAVLNVNYSCRPVASRENVTLAGAIASRELLLTPASSRTWWLEQFGASLRHEGAAGERSGLSVLLRRTRDQRMGVPPAFPSMSRSLTATGSSQCGHSPPG